MTHHPIRVVIADDHPVVRLGLQEALEPTVRCTGIAGSPGELLQALELVPCDVVVTDYAMPNAEHADGLEMVAQLRERFPSLPVVVVTSLAQLALLRALTTAGIQHMVSKADDLCHIAAAVRAARAGRSYVSPSIAALQYRSQEPGSSRRLSPREREVIELYLEGVCIAQIAAQLGRKKQTISTQKVNAMQKLGVANDAELFTFSQQVGLREGLSP
nr:response regulator transcription factor [Stenotrophomonas geniculata]